MRGNVLLITADQWRGDALSCAGHPVVRTPAVDALARGGTLFRRHFANAYPCGPARASMHTGLYAHTHRSIRNGTPLDARHGNMALEIRRAGGRPLLFGYTDTSLDPRGRAPDDPARHTYESVLPGYEPVLLLGEDAAPWLEHLAGRGHRISDPSDGRNGLFRTGGRIGDPAPFAAEEGETRFVVDAAIRHLSDLGDEPFFAHVALICPHPPFVAPAPWHDRYAGLAAPGPIRARSAAEEARTHPLLAALLETVPLAGFVPDAPGLAADLAGEPLARLRAVYWGMVSMVDAEIGRLLAWLAETGRDRDTLVIVTSDHGEMLGDHHLFGKCAWFDAAAHIPLVIRDPRAAAEGGRGRVVEAFTEAVDLMPTILDWLGLPVPRLCDGASLLPFCRGEPTPRHWRDAAHWEHDFGDLRSPVLAERLGLDLDETALVVHREARRKYVHFTRLPPLFYDLADDPGETRDRSADPAWAADCLDCVQALLSWRMRFEDRSLTGISLRDGYMERTD